MEGRHESLWIATAPDPGRPRLRQDITVDVAVVGGGIVGITTAYLLQSRGMNVAILERDRLLEGVTGHTTAKLTSQHGPRYHKIAERFGQETAAVHAEANETAKNWVRKEVTRLGIDASLETAPAFIYGTSTDDADMLRTEAEVARSIGLPASFVTTTELPFPIEGAVRFEDQAHFHPRRYLLGLLHAFEEAGGQVFEDTPVTSYNDGRPCRVHTEHGTVTARSVVVATNVPVNDRMFFVTRMKPTRAYGIAAPSDRRVEGMYINTSSPARSVRPYQSSDGPMLIFVGENHPVGHGADTDRHHARLIEFGRDHFGINEVAYRWSTQDYYPGDGLPYIGRVAPGHGNIWTATGLQGWGMSQGTAAGLMLADAIGGEENRWLDVYDPFAPKRVLRDMVRPKVLKMQAHVARLFVGDRVQAHVPHELEPGEGTIMETDGKRLAVHRDMHGALHACAAECSHMGCIVHWNHGEQSWDCPCHGSRFSGTGEVLHGPATRDLAPRPVPARVAAAERSQTETQH